MACALDHASNEIVCDDMVEVLQGPQRGVCVCVCVCMCVCMYVCDVMCVC